VTIRLEDVGVPVPLWLSQFLLPLEVTPLDDGRNWCVDAGFDYESMLLDEIIQIPTGFVTDFASIPRPLWSILPPTGTYSRAAVVHDFCYRTPGFVTRAQADAVLNEAMDLLNCAWATRQVIYRGVRIFGGSSYKGGL
jgi:hypothetical protein